MVTTCQTDADVGASDIERLVASPAWRRPVGFGSCVRGFELADLRSSRVAGAPSTIGRDGRPRWITVVDRGGLLARGNEKCRRLSGEVVMRPWRLDYD
jgi:hypothetical protein